MNLIQENISLKEYNTFGIDVKAKYLALITSVDDLKEVLNSKIYKENKSHILGGGSNALFTKDFDGLIIKMNNKGIDIINDDDDYYYLKAQAGEEWDDFVDYCVSNKIGGVENLSLIPGDIGASPVQNIGAYGVEVKDVIESCNAVELKTGQIKTFSNADCKFCYRNSTFKNENKNKFIITDVTFKLPKNYEVNVKYGNIISELERQSIKEFNIESIRKVIIDVRESKLPDHKVIGNAGSFFKNPIVSTSYYNKLKTEFPEIVGYVLNDDEVKLAAGWLIEKSGWKGKRIGDAGVHEKQALVIVNHGNASGEDIVNLSKEIKQSVNNMFGVTLHEEVNIL